MQPDEKHIDDLDYLAQQGFEKVSMNDADLDDLIKKVRSRSFSYNSGLYFGFISLVVGIFIGTSLFFIIDEDALDTLPKEPAAAIINNPENNKTPETAAISLDTVTAVKENFIDPQSKHTDVKKLSSEDPSLQFTDSVMSIPEKPVDMSMLNKLPVEEAKLKFIANAPVMYIHDLKVTDYSTLYFRNNRFVKFNERTGTAADHSNKINQNGSSGLKQEADYFLHEELAQALLYFKKGKYDQCIAALNTVAAYNDDDINCDFYLALCYYYKHNYEKAIGLFDQCIVNRNNTFLQEAFYYKAVALYDSGEKQEALKLFKQIVDEDGFYAGKAKNYLK